MPPLYDLLFKINIETLSMHALISLLSISLPLASASFLHESLLDRLDQVNLPDRQCNNG